LDRSEVAIVIPAFNEGATIQDIVQAASKHGQTIVVDDCSTDATVSLARAAGAVVVVHTMNRGYDSALNTGFAEASRRHCSYVVTLDADGQHDPALLEEFIAHLEQGADLVVGMRPRYARVAERLFALYTRMRFGLHDPLCGMKGYRMSMYRARGWFDSYQSIGTELALYAIRHKRPVMQVPVTIAQRNGVPRFARRWKANWRILRSLVLSWLPRPQ
jgi:glycosyltransferase involved in cell wall biosynthesis